jgi:hypothetical protein
MPAVDLICRLRPQVDKQITASCFSGARWAVLVVPLVPSKNHSNKSCISTNSYKSSFPKIYTNPVLQGWLDDVVDLTTLDTSNAFAALDILIVDVIPVNPVNFL